MTERYQVREGSQSGHCCFDATVVDTDRADAVCECLEREDAERIAMALNRLERADDGPGEGDGPWAEGWEQRSSQCGKCHGAGWVWRDELDDPPTEYAVFDDARYTCDRCHGCGRVKQLKPCPFCGSAEAEVHEDRGHYVECPDCFARTGQPGKPEWAAQWWNRRALPDAFPLIALGRGAVEVGEGTHEGRLALIFGRNGTGVVGEATQPARQHQPGETLAVVTFDSIASLDVVADKLAVLRAKLTLRREDEP